VPLSSDSGLEYILSPALIFFSFEKLFSPIERLNRKLFDISAIQGLVILIRICKIDMK